MEQEVYRCEACDGIMEYDVISRQLKCPNCGNTVAILNNPEAIVEHSLTLDAKRTLRPSEKTSTTMECTGCGATIELAGGDTTSACPYCGSTYVLAQKQLDSIIPDGIIPFALDRNGAQEVFRRWIGKRLLAPAKLRTLYQRDTMQRLYLPYWTFDARTDADYTAMGGRYRTERCRDRNGNTQTRTVTDWYHTSGHIRYNFDDMLVKAVGGERSAFLKSVEPYDMGRMVSYAPQYLQGCVSQCYEIGLDAAHTEARGIMDAALRADAESDVLSRYDTVRNVNISPTYRDETYKHILVPVYSAPYHYEGKNYQVAINGQTGSIHGSYPKSPVKIAAIVIAALLLIIAILCGQYEADRRYSLEDGAPPAAALCSNAPVEETIGADSAEMR
ncbi:MAG: hypothetical protein NC337_10325 [Roseburia sp.]|nr:hypothetical protein [Roseburia sp.]